MLRYNPRHVSSSIMLIFRRSDCIITASGIVTLCKRQYSMSVESGLSKDNFSPSKDTFSLSKDNFSLSGDDYTLQGQFFTLQGHLFTLQGQLFTIRERL